MVKNNLNKGFVVIGLIVVGFLILPQFDKTRQKEDEKMPSFYDAKINAQINENLESGYLFNVSNKTYKPGTYHYVIQAKQNDARIEFLSDEDHSNFEDSITFSWRQTKAPYTVIKKAKADTLYIIKKGREIAFLKYLDKE